MRIRLLNAELNPVTDWHDSPWGGHDTPWAVMLAICRWKVQTVEGDAEGSEALIFRPNTADDECTKQQPGERPDERTERLSDAPVFTMEVDNLARNGRKRRIIKVTMEPGEWTPADTDD